MISSTAIDLPDHRDAVRDACLRRDITPLMMHFQGAEAGDFLRRSLALVDEADLYVLVLGFRYGTIAPERNAVVHDSSSSTTTSS